MKFSYWIDTSFFYALFSSHDQNHACAAKLWDAGIRKNRRGITSNLVLSELGTLLAYHFGHKTAVERIVMLYETRLIEIVHSDRECENAALLWWKKYADKKFSFPDCVSFEFMSRLGLKQVLTFDSDFMLAGYHPVNNQPVV